MGVLTVFSTKGGCGASLVATNLGVALARSAPTLLMDLHDQDGTDDLLLDLRPARAWPDLLPVAVELTERHVDLVACRHASGLALLASPASPSASGALHDARLHVLLESLAKRVAWLIIDSPSGIWSSVPTEVSSTILLVSTGDPAALRCAKRLLDSRPRAAPGCLGLVLNQVSRGQPASAPEIAASLETPLLAAIPVDPRGVGYQVHFGHACVLDRQSAFGHSVVALARRLSVTGTAKLGAAASASVTPGRAA